MPYTPVPFENWPSTATPLSAEVLNEMQDVVIQASADATAAVAAITAPTDAAVTGVIVDDGSDARAALDALYPTRAEVDQVADASNFAGVDSSGVSECSSALQDFFNYCESVGIRAFGRGTYKVSSTVTIACDTDFGGATFNYDGSSIAVQIGKDAAPLQRKTIIAPKIIYTPKVAIGWAAGRVGLRISSSYACIITVPHIKNFETGLMTYGQNSQGVSYNTITVGGLDNNKVNLNLTGDATGWSNQNTFIGGRFSHDSGEGAIVSGTRHIMFTDIPASRPNGNTFVGCSIESPNVVQYAIDIDAGVYNVFLNVRLENTGPDPRIRFGAKAQQNGFYGGFGLSHTAITKVSGSVGNNLFTTDRIEFAGPNDATMRLENRASSSIPSLGVYNAGTLAGSYDPAADYSVALHGGGVNVKNKTDTPANARVRVTPSGIFFGDGANPAAGYITGNALTLQLSGLPVRFPSYTTAGRPIASVVGAAVMIYDTTLGKPIFSNGTTWRDASGAAV